MLIRKDYDKAKHILSIREIQSGNYIVSELFVL